MVDLREKAGSVAGSPKGRRKPSLFRSLMRDKSGAVGLTIVVLVFAAAVLAPILSPHDPTRTFSAYRLQGPSVFFPLGADELGRDLLSRALYGAQVSLQVSVTVAISAGLIGTIAGLVAGYVGGVFDAIVMRVVDVLFAFPTILLALAVVATLGPATSNLIVALVVVYVPAFARIARAATLSVSREVFVDAGRSVGLSGPRLLLRHVLPNVTAPILVQLSVALAEIILVEAALSYLGLGVQPPSPSWGAMLASGKAHMEASMLPSVVPGLFIMVTVLGFNLLGDAFRDLMDPKLQRKLG